MAPRPDPALPPKERRPRPGHAPLSASELILIASVVCLVAAAAIQAVIALVADMAAN